MKTALSMEGGAMRGMFTCGVIDVLMEQGITFDAAAGISAGAAFGCNFKSHQIGRPIRYNKRYGRDPRYMSIRSLLKTGDLYNADFCYRELPDVLDPFDRKAFRENPMAFYIGATDVRTGKPVYHLCSDGEEADILWMRASASMPLVSKPVSVDGYLLLDGGITDPVPLAHMQGLGFDRHVVILTQPKGYRKEKSGGMPFMRLMLRKYPEIVRAMGERHRVYNQQMEDIDRQEEAGAVFVIRPPAALGIQRTETRPEELERVYQTGRKEAAARLHALKQFLKG
ncbi:MAG: patatin family protein [Clostridiales bacterium]|nr:patatin family protein [Clostridiales bacterium]